VRTSFGRSKLKFLFLIMKVIAPEEESGVVARKTRCIGVKG
jgi:hypothetical protein